MRKCRSTRKWAMLGIRPSPPSFSHLTKPSSSPAPCFQSMAACRRELADPLRTRNARNGRDLRRLQFRGRLCAAASGAARCHEGVVRAEGALAAHQPPVRTIGHVGAVIVAELLIDGVSVPGAGKK